MIAPDTLLRDVPIASLRPTQMCVGYREVDAKRRHWVSRHLQSEGQAPEPVVVPVVIGPRQTLFMVDRHHLMRALLSEGVQTVIAKPVADLTELTIDVFWDEMHHRGWCRPHDEAGVRRPFFDIPRSIHDLRDDPYRSLAGALRRHKAFLKRRAPYAEFIWADFLRGRINKNVVIVDFSGAVAEALMLARSAEAAHLPGWIAADQDSDIDVLPEMWSPGVS